jgi:hypothetical protein
MTDPVASWSTLALAIFSLAAVGVAYWGIKKQTESFATSVSADICLKLIDRFDSPAMLATRSLAAKALLDKSHPDQADDLFDFFELVGLYVRRNMLDTEVAHSMFFHWTNLYWHASKEYIKKEQERSADIYRDFEDLYGRLLAIEMMNAPKSRDINPTEADVAAFLNQEVVQ